MFLTPDELHQLTGYKRLAAQTKWLVEIVWPFVVGDDGNPKLRESCALLTGRHGKPWPQ